MAVLKNPKHERFAQELAKGTTATEAYVLVGYKDNDGNASKLAAKVQARVMEITGKAAEKAGVTIERIMTELSKIGFADITRAVEWGEALSVKGLTLDGNDTGEPLIVQGVALIASADLPPEVTAAISEVRKTKEGISIKFHDKRAALVDMGKHLGMFVEKHEHTGKDGQPIAIVDLSDSEAARRIAFTLAKATQPTTH